MPETNHFPFGPDGEDSDLHRRVTAQCMRPRSATEIAYAFSRLDPNVPSSAYHRDGVQPVLDELEQAGLVKKLDEADAAALLDQQNADPDLIDFHGDPDAFVSRSQHPGRFPYLDRGWDHYVMTTVGHAKLTGEAPPRDAAGVVLVGSAAEFAQQERNGHND